jgi:hypothetical protein
VLEIVLASIAVVVAVAALVVSLTRDTGRNRATEVTTTTMSAQQLCAAKQASFDKQLQFLKARQARLQELVPVVLAPLAAEMSTNTPNANRIDAAHQATLRELERIQQRILRLEDSKPPNCP